MEKKNDPQKWDRTVQKKRTIRSKNSPKMLVQFFILGGAAHHGYQHRRRRRRRVDRNLSFHVFCPKVSLITLSSLVHSLEQVAADAVSRNEGPRRSNGRDAENKFHLFPSLKGLSGQQ